MIIAKHPMHCYTQEGDCSVGRRREEGKIMGRDCEVEGRGGTLQNLEVEMIPRAWPVQLVHMLVVVFFLLFPYLCVCYTWSLS
jgi:hypothetical protein